MADETQVRADCESCGGLNTSCPDGCARDPATGELIGTPPPDPYELALIAIASMKRGGMIVAGTPEADRDFAIGQAREALAQKHGVRWRELLPLPSRPRHLGDANDRDRAARL